MSNNLLTVTEFSKVCQVTPRTIRWYQQKGILKPVKIDHYNKYAYFAPEQALDVFRVKLLQQFNLPLNQISNQIKSKKIISFDAELKRLEQFIKQKQKELTFLKQNQPIFSEDSDIGKFLVNEPIGPFKLLCKKIENGDYHKIEEYITNLRKVAKILKLKVENSEMNFYLDPDLKYKPKKSPLEVALILGDNKRINSHSLPKNYFFKSFPKTLATTLVFRGPYIYLPLVYKKLDTYMEKKEVKLKGSVIELYIKNPINTVSSFDYKTKIGYPI